MKFFIFSLIFICFSLEIQPKSFSSNGPILNKILENIEQKNSLRKFTFQIPQKIFPKFINDQVKKKEKFI